MNPIFFDKINILMRKKFWFQNLNEEHLFCNFFFYYNKSKFESLLKKDISFDFVTKDVFEFTIKTAVGGFSFLFLNNLCQNRNKKSIGWFSH
jgi:hypothetical protein